MIKFYPSVLNGSLKAPASKSHGLRLLFAAAMASTPTKIENLPVCDDLDTAIDCLRQLGCKIDVRGAKRPGDRITLKIEPFPKTATLKTMEFNFRESATTARYISTICAVLGIPANCRAEGTLTQRSQVMLTSRMALRGANFSSFSFPLHLDGRMIGGEYEIEGDESSQNICALLTALPAAKNDSYIKLTSPVKDKTFIDLTLDTLAQFKVRIEEREDGYFIPGQQYYKAPRKLSCENDWGLATMWTTAGASCSLNGGSVSVNDLPADSHQKYRNVQDLFPFLSQNFKELTIDASDCPNLATVFAALAIARGATVHIEGVPQLKFKESNRLKSIGMCCGKYGVTCEDNNDGFTLSGKDDADYPENMVVDTMGDPWVFMAMAIAALSFKKPIVLTDEHCADKIYKDFLHDYELLGGKFEIIE